MAQGKATMSSEGAPTAGDHERETLTAGERIIGKFHPHPMSFIRWYLPSILLMIWTAFYLGIVLFAPNVVEAVRGLLGNFSGVAVLVLWVVGAILIGMILPRNPRTSKANVTAGTFLRAVQVLYMILVVLPVAMFFLLELRNPGTDYSLLIYVYTIAVSALMLLLYNLYRRSFTYFITNFRVIFRYKFFKSTENNLRFSQIRDVEVDRTTLQRIFKLGNVRPYTGAEENLVDLTPGYDSPDECFFGVRSPEYVKRLILEQMLGPQDHSQDASQRTDAGMRAATVAAGQAAGAAVAAGQAQQVQRLEQELAQMRAERAATPAPAAPARPAAAPRVSSEALRAPPSDPAPPQPAKPREHATFGDDRDGLHSSDVEFRSGTEKPKKPAPSGTSADDDDKPRSI
jgi:hypothetical protein